MGSNKWEGSRILSTQSLHAPCHRLGMTPLRGVKVCEIKRREGHVAASTYRARQVIPRFAELRVGVNAGLA